MSDNPTPKSPLTARLSLDFKRLGAPVLSPDGSFAIASISECILEENRFQTDLWLFPLSGEKAQKLSSHAASSSSPAISPDGKYLAFLSKRDKDQAAQLYLLPLAGGEAIRVTNLPFAVSEPRWFADSQHIAFTTRVWPGFIGWEDQKLKQDRYSQQKSSAKIWNSAPVMDWDAFTDERECHIFRTNIEGKEPVALTVQHSLQLPRFVGGPFGNPQNYAIHPNGLTLAIACAIPIEPGVYQQDIFVLDLVKGTSKNCTSDNPANDMAPSFSPDGTKLLWLRQSVVGFYGDTKRLLIASADGEDRRILHQDWDRSMNGLAWAADSKSLFGCIEDAATIRLYSIPIDGGKPIPLTQDSSFDGVTVSTKLDAPVVALRQSFTEAPVLVAIDPKTQLTKKLSSLNDLLESSIDWGRFESTRYQGSDNESIQMWINYPPNFDPQNKYPLFLMIHGGPHVGISNLMHWRWNAQIFAGMGYVTAWHNFHGSSGFGQDFADSINPDWVTKPYQDTIKAAEWFMEKPWIDSQRMVAGGGSYGGYLSTILLGRQHPFQALIAHAAVYNLYTQYGCDFHYHKSRHGDFWENPELFQKISPHYQAAHFKTPTLIIHGHLDYRVPINHAMELFHVLQRRGIESRLVYFPDENHWVLKPQNSLKWYDEVSAWIHCYTQSGDFSNP